MNPSRIFILRPVATSLLMAAIVLTGLLAYRLLPLSALPQVDYPTIQVVTLYPGASPDVMASSVTAPLERQFGQMPGLDQMASASSGGASVVTLQFSLSLGLDVAEQEVQAAINAAGTFLPTDLPNPPIYNKINPADAPILTLALTSKILPVTKVEDYADTRLAQKISQLPGVGLVSIGGGQRPAVRIRVNPDEIASYGIGLDDVRAAIGANNVNQPKGSFDGPTRAYSIDANDQLYSAEEYAALVVAYKNGAPVFLSDIADIVDGAENTRLEAWANRTPGVILNIQRQPGSNVIEVVDNIKKLLPQMQAGLPASIDVSILTDRTITIRASVADTRFELMLAIALVIMVMFMFLRNIPATIIPSFAVPISLIGTFGFMYLSGFSINNLTLMSLTIATGFVVDDAIVVIENISRYVEAGLPPLEAALKGSQQIGFTIISLTFSLIAVLIPLLFMGDVVGRLFREFSITLAVSILISAIVSLTLTPMMCAKLLHRAPEEKTHGFTQKIIEKYGQTLNWVLDRQGSTLLVALATLMLSVALYVFIPKGFFPIQDTGVIRGLSEAPQSISFPAMAKLQESIADIILEDPAVQSLSSFIGVDGTNEALNGGRFLINLKPMDERKASVTEIIDRLDGKLKNITGASLFLQPVQDLTMEDRVGRGQYQFTLEDPDSKALAEFVAKLVEKLHASPALRNVTSDLRDNSLQAYISINRDTAGELGVTVAAIDSALYDAFGQRIVSTLFTQANQYRVVLEVKPRYRLGVEALGHIYVTSSSGKQVPLSMLAKVSEKPAPLAIDHEGQFPSANISFDLAPDASLGEALNSIEAAKQDIGIPQSMQTRYQGAALAFRASLENEVFLLFAAIVTMYIVLGILYESFIHPVTILSTLPSAGIGALLALMIARIDLGVIGIIGIVLLIGIVKKNAIMMIDFALEAERAEGRSPREAIYQACLLRFRPILMTTLSALLSALPLMLGRGIGAELRHPLGVAMVGGLLVSQVLTLYTTPVIYLAMGRLKRKKI